MAEHILFLTGKLAERSLRKVLAEIGDQGFSFDIEVLGISVAGLMTTDMICRRLAAVSADRILVPGRCRGDLGAVQERFGVPAERGPNELKDLPRFFGVDGPTPDLSEHRVRIFAEIVDAPRLTTEQALDRAREFRRDGANVIDVGCLPQTKFPHLEELVAALKEQDFSVSVDSLVPDDLLRGARAGADYLLSLTRDTLWIADEVAATPVLIPCEHGDMQSLFDAIEHCTRAGRPYIADSILDPIHFGFTESVLRYRNLRERYGDAPIMMGTGNLTELTEADTTGITALLMGMVSELEVGNVLVTQVSPHCSTAVREADRARRIMHYAQTHDSLPKHIDGGLAATHECQPYPYSAAEIAELAAAVKDPSFRIQVSEDGIHVYNRDGSHVAIDPYRLYPLLGVEEDGGHAFYLGVELARAQIAAQLGKRYVQDEELDWGCLVDRQEHDDGSYREPGTTLHVRRRGGADQT